MGFFIVANVKIFANDRSGLLRDITTILANDKVNVLAMSTDSDVNNQVVTMGLKLEVYNLSAFNRVLDKISQVEEVMKVKRS